MKVRLTWAYALVVGCGFAPQPASSVGGDAAPKDAATGDSPHAALRKPITIHATAVTGTQTDFPVWIDLDLGADARADGTDISFTAADGTPLDYEVQRWAPPHLQAWVRVPSLAHADLTLFVTYGDVAQAHAANPPGVFRASFAAVWHLEDTLAATTIADATGLHPGTAGSLGPAAQVPGELGGGIAFDGTGNEQIAFTDPLTGNMPHTISAWVDESATNHTCAIVTVGTGNTDQSRFLYGQYGNNTTIGVGQYNDDWTPGTRIDGTGWVLVHWVHEGNNKKTHVYRNGVEIAGSPHTLQNPPATTGSTGLIGNAPSPQFGSDNGMLGTIDEVRIATVMRDPSWIATEYANQSSPSTFYTVGAEQTVP